MNKKIYVGFAGIVLATLLIVSTSAWNQSASPKTSVKDTIPKQKKIVDLDEAMRELDRSMLQMEKELSKQDWSKIDKEIKEAMKEVDVAKMKIDIDNAMKEIDFSKMQAEIQKALKEVDSDKIKADIQASISKIDMEKIKKELENVKIDMAGVEKELKELKPEIEKSLNEAKKSIEKAKAEMKEYKTFIDDLDKSGLIDKDGTYTVEHKNNELFINGKKQPADIYNKYKTFLEKNKDIIIKKSGDGLNINKD